MKVYSYLLKEEMVSGDFATVGKGDPTPEGKSPVPEHPVMKGYQLFKKRKQKRKQVGKEDPKVVKI